MYLPCANQCLCPQAADIHFHFTLKSIFPLLILSIFFLSFFLVTYFLHPFSLYFSFLQKHIYAHTHTHTHTHTHAHIYSLHPFWCGYVSCISPSVPPHALLYLLLSSSAPSASIGFFVAHCLSVCVCVCVCVCKCVYMIE